MSTPGMLSNSHLPSYETVSQLGNSSSPHNGTEPPIYSSQPTPNEETVAYTPRDSERRPQQCQFEKRWSQATLILDYQEEGVKMPTYGRNSIIEGELGLENPERITSVTMKLSGLLATTASELGSFDFGLCSVTKVLWEQEGADTSTQQPKRCPSILPVSIPFPSSYTWEGREYRMPPTFEGSFLSTPAFIARVQYTLHLTITRLRSWNQSWFANKKYTLLINYRPRTRPARPIVLLDSVVASIKPHPEEWTQIVTRMETRPKFQDAKPIDCQVFIPSGQTFGLNEPIPFHIQLTGTLSSLRELLPAKSAQLLPNPDRKAAARRLGTQLDLPIRVALTRQLVIDMNDRRKFKNFIIGQGRIWPVPPLPALIVQGSSRVDYTPNASGSPKDAAFAVDRSVMNLNINPQDIYGEGREVEDPDTEYNLDWQGELRGWDDVTVGGFASSHLGVKDFLTVSLHPPNPRSSFLAPLQLSYPIRLVTDPWTEDSTLHPSDR